MDKKYKPRLPVWLKRRLGAFDTFNATEQTLRGLGIATICTNANCPNRGECWSEGTATVLVLGNICTRNCKFCSVGAGVAEEPDASEPRRVAEMAKRMGLKYLVITSVTRDDLPDGGAGHFRDVINAVREKVPGIGVELLVPDFQHCQDEAIGILADAMPFVFGHNIETVRRLYAVARSGADYDLSLELLEKAKGKWGDVVTKSSIMLGLGETDDEVIEVLKDLRKVQCDRVAIGQYLRPSKESLDVAEYVTPEKFGWWKKTAEEMGFKWVMSSPYTRSSYHADREVV